VEECFSVLKLWDRGREKGRQAKGVASIPQRGEKGIRTMADSFSAYFLERGKSGIYFVEMG
jgi:hypothetical protein